MENAMPVTEIFNDYIENGTAAFADAPLPGAFFSCCCGRIGRKRHRILLAERLCPCSEFLENGQNHLFIAREHAGKGMGKLCFDRLEADARQMGMENIIAEISLETA